MHWGLIRPYDTHSEFGEHVARPQDEAARHNSVASSVWQRAEARNRSCAREPDAPFTSYPRPHQRSDSCNRPRSWAPQSRTPRLQPSPSDPHHRATQQPGHAEPPGHRAARHALDHPARDRTCQAQRPRAPSAAPLDGPSGAYQPSEDYRRSSTLLPARSRNPPTHGSLAVAGPACRPARYTYRDHQPWSMYISQNAAYTGPWGSSPTWHQLAQPQQGLHWGKHHWDYTGTALHSGSPRPQPLA